MSKKDEGKRMKDKKGMKLDWRKFVPYAYSNVSREGWEAKMGDLKIYVFQTFRLQSGERAWSGGVDGCSANIGLLGYPSHVRCTAEEAKQRAEAQLRELMAALGGKP